MGYLVWTGIVVVLVVLSLFATGAAKREEVRALAEGNERLARDARRIRLGGWTLAGLLVVIFFGLVTPLKSIDTVENGHIGILKQFGSLVGTTGERFVTQAPWKSLAQVSVQNEIRTYRMTDSGEGFIGAAVSADSQPIFMDVVVDYSLVREKAVALYRITGGHYVERKLDPAVPQLAKEVTANYKAIDFAKNRERIRQQIQQRLRNDLLPLGIRINTISLRNVDFTPALKEAIEQTVEAEQQAKRAQAQVAIKEAEAKQAIAEAAGEAQANVERAQGEAEANVTRARGEATANRLRRQNLTPAVLQHEAIDKLNPKVQVIVCPPRTICIPNGSTVVPSP